MAKLKATAGAVSALALAAAGLAAVIAPDALAQDAAPDAGQADRATSWNPGDFDSAWAQYQAREAAAGGGAQTPPDSVDWSGLWENDPPFSFTLQPGEPLIGRGFATETGMKLTPRYQAELEYRIRKAEEGDDFDPLTYCLPSGFPRWLVEPFMKEFAPTDHITYLMNEAGAEVRRVYTDGRGHIPEEFAYPMWFGDSIGFWDGETLVIHTNNIKANLLQREQPAVSNQAETVEEWTEISDGVMQVKGSLYDPEALTEPFHFVRYYRQVANPDGAIRIVHWSCAENQPVVRTAEGGSNFGAIPGTEQAENLSDPETWLGFDEAEELGINDEFGVEPLPETEDEDAGGLPFQTGQ